MEIGELGTSMEKKKLSIEKSQCRPKAKLTYGPGQRSGTRHTEESLW